MALHGHRAYQASLVFLSSCHSSGTHQISTVGQPVLIPGRLMAQKDVVIPREPMEEMDGDYNF